MVTVAYIKHLDFKNINYNITVILLKKSLNEQKIQLLHIIYSIPCTLQDVLFHVISVSRKMNYYVK